MAEPAENEYTIYRGSSPILRFAAPSNAPVTDPASGWACTWTLRKSRAATTILLQKDATWNATTSTFDVALTDSETLGVKASPEDAPYVASLFRTDDGSEDAITDDEVVVKESIFYSKSDTTPTP